MKKILITLTGLLLLFLASCDGVGGYDMNVCYAGVRAKFPKAHIYHEPGHTTIYWVVIDSDGTYYRVQTYNESNGNVTSCIKQVELK